MKKNTLEKDESNVSAWSRGLRGVNHPGGEMEPREAPEAQEIAVEMGKTGGRVRNLRAPLSCYVNKALFGQCSSLSTDSVSPSSKWRQPLPLPDPSLGVLGKSLKVRKALMSVPGARCHL